MSVRKLYTYIGIVLTVWMSSVNKIVRGQPTQPSIYNSLFTPHIFSLDSGWYTTDQVFKLPFKAPSSQDELTLTYNWESECMLPDTFYLYLTGVAWQAELTLNGRFLSVNDLPLHPWVIPISRDWITESSNEIKLFLRKGPPKLNMPRPFLGITGNIWVLDREQLTYWQASPIQRIPRSDSVVVWAPYLGIEQDQVHDSVFFHHIYHLLQTGHKNVYFPYPPDRQFLTLSAKAGLVAVDSLTKETHVGMLNPYPYESIFFTIHNKFWLDNTGKRTAYYDTFFSNDTPFHIALTFQPWMGFILLALFPLMAMMLVKLINSNFFFSLHKLYIKPDVYIDTLNEVTGGNIGFILVLVIIKIFIHATLLSLGIYYIAWTNNWDFLNIFSAHSLLYDIYYPSIDMSRIFIRSLGIVIGWQLVKYIIHNLAGGLFNIRNLAIGGFNLDIAAIFPYLMIVNIPLIGSFFMASHTYSWGIIALVIALIIYFRQLYIMYLGLERLFNFSLGVKILYICAFKVVPYIIWF